MTNAYSKEWSIFTSSFGVWCIFHSLAYILIFKKLRNTKKQNALSAEKCKIVCGTVLSMVNAIILVFTAMFDLFYYRKNLWTKMYEETEPGILFYSLSQMLAYMIIDSIGEIGLYLYYRNSESAFKNFDYTIIIHHIISVLSFAIHIPKPVFYWFIGSILSMVEISTIFLNLINFGTYFKTSKTIKKYSKFGFLLAWFLIRTPAILVAWWSVIFHWKKFFGVSLWRACILFVILVSLSILHSVWTIKITKKKYSKFGFLLAWFLIRTPAILVAWWSVIFHWKKFFGVSLWRACILFVILVSLSILHSVWTIKITKKIIKYFTANEIANVVHATTVQLGW
eukprot:556558_1